MKLNFRIDWGYQYLYSRRHYHPYYNWDGALYCSAGEILKSYQLEYPVIWFGPGHCPKETLLPTPAWNNTTRRRFSGARFETDVPPEAIFHLDTASAQISFSAKELQDKKRLVFPIGPKYLGCSVIVTLDRFYWFLPAPRPNQQLWLADDLAASVPVHDWARMRTAWIAPNSRMAFDANIAQSDADETEQILHIVAMAAPGYTPGREQVIHDFFTVRLYCDGAKIAEQTRYYREHDDFMQMLEDMWLRFKATPGKHHFELENAHATAYFLVTRMVLQPSEHFHLQFSLPTWGLCNQEMIGRIYATHADHTTIAWPGGSTELDVTPGWNDFRFTIDKPLKNAIFSSKQSLGYIPAIYALKDETPEVTVGYDMTVVPHDDSGSMDWLLDYTWRSQLGNLVVFRNFIKESVSSDKIIDPADSLLKRWGDFCRVHNIHVEAATSFDTRALTESAGNMLHSVGMHEWPGAVYAFDPQPEWQSEDMQEAMEHYIKRLKIQVDRGHKAAPRMAFGDASGGHRYCYMAGADFIRTETMVPHTQHLCSQARPAAEVFRNGEWGVHIAIQHPVQPYQESHLRTYFLSLYQPWMMGASMIYEEDSLFELFKEERQAWDDALTKGKRDMTREFFRFVKTHPRTGKVQRRIAFIEGRYAAPFNGFICDSEQTPDYSVWGLFGNPDPTWGHRQPEKCRQLLDVLMPGASTHPLRQDFTRRRFFFSGTPYGDFDEVPTEATADYLKQYSLLLHLGWNTMIEEDYDKLKQTVANGATLLIGLPQFSTHKKRQFLADMSQLALWNNGDLMELCGTYVLGCGETFSGDWNGPDRMSYPNPTLSGIPSSNINEDGPCRLANVILHKNARPVIWDSTNCKPLVVRYHYGKGTVYLVTAYAYPGHEQLRQVMAALIAKLCQEHQGDICLEDKSGEVFWNVWQSPNGTQQLMALNTDWTTPGNSRQVTVNVGDFKMELSIVEGKPTLLTILPFAVLQADTWLHLEILSCSASAATLRVHGSQDGTVRIWQKDGAVFNHTVTFTDQTSLDWTLQNNTKA